MAKGFDIITIFPEIISSYCSQSILGKANAKALIDVKPYNLRDFTTDKHKTVDDYPYGGGSGMVMKIEPLQRAIEAVKSDGKTRRTILMSPQGRRFDQSVAEELAADSRRLLMICGRYEGIDDRIRSFIDEEVSIGDYVLTGGELASLVIIDSVSRLLPGVLGDDESSKEESFSWGILDYPHYTRPPEFMGMKVPEVLLSGNHKEIEAWRRAEAIKRTLALRPELLDRAGLSKEDRKILDGLCPDESFDIQRSKTEE
ncbi:MAG: tRNA (guanosine(37)-N1)-methyltransferase TrmD [Nitrospiraceae bacterium]|nr:tRNA (guanosine(37)-N1)-methyltransferase TrmD [Nitrospiraceae bacterium]